MATHIALPPPAAVTVGTSPTTLGTIGNVRGASAVVVELYGGQNVGLNLIGATPSSRADGSQSPSGDGATPTLSATACSGAQVSAAEGAGFLITITPGTADGIFHVPYLTIKATVASGSNAGVGLNAWAVHSSPTAPDLGGWG